MSHGFAAGVVGLPFGRNVTAEPAGDGMLTARADVDLQSVGTYTSISLESVAEKLDHS